MPANVIPRGKRFGARATVNGRQLWLGTFDSREEASAAVARASGGHGPAGSVADWFAGWPLLAAARRGRSEETIAHTARLAAPFVDAFGSWKLVSVSRGDAAAWAMRHSSHARYARTILADAVWAGRLDTSPLDGVRLGSSSTPAVRLEAADVDRIAGAGCAQLRVLVLVAAYSGLRLSEALALEARDLVDDVLHVRCGKGGKAGHSVLFEPGLSVLRAVLPDVGRVFPPGWERKGVNRRWRAACETAGVSARFHDLRHFHATMLLERGLARADVAAQLRHAGLRDVDRYLSTRIAGPMLERVREVAGC